MEIVRRGSGKDTKKKKAKSVTINRRRLFDVLFSDLVRPKMDELGAPLTHEELDWSIKSDQEYHEFVASEYNKHNVIEYGNNAFPHLRKGRVNPPSNFQEIGWIKSKQLWKDICNEYDFCFKA